MVLSEVSFYDMRMPEYNVGGVNPQDPMSGNYRTDTRKLNFLNIKTFIFKGQFDVEKHQTKFILPQTSDKSTSTFKQLQIQVEMSKLDDSFKLSKIETSNMQKCKTNLSLL